MWFIVVNVRPIPKRLLLHSIVYTEKVKNDRWGKNDPVTIDKVLVQPASTLNIKSNRQDVTADHLLFIDRVNSSHFFKMTEGSKVKFGDEDEWIVSKVKTLYALSDDPHHYEVELI